MILVGTGFEHSKVSESIFVITHTNVIRVDRCAAYIALAKPVQKSKQVRSLRTQSTASPRRPCNMFSSIADLYYGIEENSYNDSPV